MSFTSNDRRERPGGEDAFCPDRGAGVGPHASEAAPPGPRQHRGKLRKRGICGLARSIGKDPDSFSHVVRDQMRRLLNRMSEDEIVEIMVR